MFDRTPVSRAATLAALVLASTTPAFAQGGANGVTARVSLTSFGQQALASATAPSISRDGACIAFETAAALLPTDTNGVKDIYVVEVATGALQIASNSVSGTPGNGHSFDASLSGDGRWVAFTSSATNLFGFDTNGTTDVFLRDLQTGTLERVSANIGSFVAGSNASAHPSLSYDGRYVAFDTRCDEFSALDTNGGWDVYVRDLQLDAFTLVSRGFFGASSNGSCTRPSISDDGRFVAFEAYADNLVLGDGNALLDVYVRDLSSTAMQLVSRVPGGALGNGASWGASISADGRYVAFATDASNFVFGDANNDSDVYVLDRTLSTLRLVNRSVTGGFCATVGADSPCISGDGRFVAFTSSAPDVAPQTSLSSAVYLRDLSTDATRLVSRPTGPTTLPSGSAGGATLDADGTTVAFDSVAGNLVAGDTNGVPDVFVRELLPDPVSYCTSSLTSAGCQPTLSSTGLPRAGQNSGFVVHCNDAPNNKPGLLFYGFNGRLDAPFLAGTLCVQLPVARTPVAQSGGNPVSIDDCSGAFQLDLNSYAAGLLGAAPLPELSAVGQRVNVQYWGRDPAGAAATTFLSNALEYVVGP